MGCIHSDTAHLAKEVAWPISAFSPRAVAGEIPPPYAGVAPPADSGQPAASRRGRCYWGASLASTDSFGTRLTARDSPMRPAGGEEDGG
jgi:hypothetical protein